MTTEKKPTPITFTDVSGASFIPKEIRIYKTVDTKAGHFTCYSLVVKKGRDNHYHVNDHITIDIPQDFIKRFYPELVSQVFLDFIPSA